MMEYDVRRYNTIHHITIKIMRRIFVWSLNQSPNRKQRDRFLSSLKPRDRTKTYQNPLEQKRPNLLNLSLASAWRLRRIPVMCYLGLTFSKHQVSGVVCGRILQKLPLRVVRGCFRWEFRSFPVASEKV